MKLTKWYNLKKPQRLVPQENDVADINDLNFNADSIDNILKTQADEDVRLEQDKLNKIGNSKDNVVTFVESIERANISTGETHATLFGKIKKWLTDLKPVAFSGDKADVGLGNADNTSDTDKNVLSATKLTTSRTINGVNFDGTANITIADSTKEPAFNKNTAFNKNFGDAAGTVTQGNDNRLSDSRPASDVYDWAKAELKPSYNYNEILDSPYIPINNDFTLSGLSDTLVTSPINGQLLSWNGSKWININPQSFSQSQTNWTETNTSSVQYIQNKPTNLSQFTNDLPNLTTKERA